LLAFVPNVYHSQIEGVFSSKLRSISKSEAANLVVPASLHDSLRTLTEETSLPSLLRYEDRNSMAHSVEARVPYLDHRVVELAFRLPANVKVRGVSTKDVLKRAMRGAVPTSILDRKDKVGFRADPTVTWMLARGNQAELVENVSDYEREWFQPAGLQKLIEGNRDSPVMEFLLWRVINTKLWLRQNWN
jgi:asparagine synthase (glutamine-hydrolysing)